MSITRYAIRDGVWAEDGVGGPYMAEVPEGEFVKHDDHVAEVERLTADLAAEQDALTIELARKNARLTAERDGLAKALFDIKSMTYYKAISDQTDAPRLAHLVNQTARAALAALPTAPKEDDA